MCEFCASHGGKTRWYLNPENYSETLLEDKKRMKILYNISGYGIDYYLERTTRLGKLANLPVVGGVFRKIANWMSPGMHSGQVVTTEEAIKVLELADNVCILECMCRRLVHAEKKAVCINFGPIKELFEMLKPSERIEVRPIDEVQELVRECASQGLYHEVLWAKIPYPVVICNCQVEYCCAAKLRFLYNIQKSLVKGHFVSSVTKKCDGCEGESSPICVEKCPFKAMTYNAEEKRAIVNQQLCFGCGVCKNLCPKDAIALIPRESIPAIKHLW